MVNVQLPFVPGSECSAVITHCLDKSMVGKKVSMLVESGGAWQEYIKGNLKNIILMNDDADLDDAACGFVTRTHLLPPSTVKVKYINPTCSGLAEPGCAACCKTRNNSDFSCSPKFVTQT